MMPQDLSVPISLQLAVLFEARKRMPDDMIVSIIWDGQFAWANEINRPVKEGAENANTDNSGVHA